MSRFAGWVQFRRGIIDHLISGKLTPNEYLALTQLILLADAETGGDRINAPMLRHYCGEAFSQNTAQKILADLHQRGYVWYRGRRFNAKPQPYWVNNYLLTKGAMRGRMTRLWQLLGKSAISQQDVWRLADESVDVAVDDSVDGSVDNYKTREERFENREITPTTIPSSQMTQSKIASLAASLNASQTASTPASMRTSQAASGTHPVCVTAASLNASSKPYVLTPPMPETIAVADPATPKKMVYWGDAVPGHKYIDLGRGDSKYKNLATGKFITDYDELCRVIKEEAYGEQGR